MGLFDKVKNLFTEEIEEEPQPIKKEVRHIEVSSPKPSIEKKEPIETKKEEPTIAEEKTTREEKFVFFSDDDFKDLEKPKVSYEPKKEIIKKEEKPLAYKGAIPQTKVEPKKEFKPSPIISPVYGVLNKNYQKEEIKTKKPSSRVYRSSNLTVDEVRNKAYGTLEDEIKDDLLGRTMIEEEPIVQNNINIFDELDSESFEEEPVILSRSTDNVDEIFGKLDNKKEEIIEELDNKKEEILDELDSKKESFDLLSSDYQTSDDDSKEYLDDIDISKNLLDDDNFSEELDDEASTEIEDDTELLAKELEEQKKKLSEINDMMNENSKSVKTKTSKKKAKVEDDLDESELFDLIDSIYEKKDDE